MDIQTTTARQMIKEALPFLDELMSGKPVFEPKNKSKERVRILLESTPGKYLLQRTNQYSGLRVPGGGIEAGETPTQAAVRELHEELGVPEALSKKYLKYIGPNYQKGYTNEHYFTLRRHGVNPGRYVASNNPREIVHIVEGGPGDKGYVGPDIDLLKTFNKLANKSLVNKIRNFVGGYFHDSNNRSHPAEIREESNSGPKPINDTLYRLVALKTGNPMYLRSAAGDYAGQEGAPDESWYENKEGPLESYWTSHGLKRYLNSGNYDYHRALADSDLAVMVAKSPKHIPSYTDEYQAAYKPGSVNPDDMFFVDKNREKPLTAAELINRYNPQPALHGSQI